MTTEAVTKARRSQSVFIRRLQFYSLFATLITDAYASKAESFMHLTLWSWLLHTLYFELVLPSSSSFAIRLLHGPSMGGAHALFAMYVWVLYANPNMEYDLAPKGRPRWLILARAFWLHFAPVIFHWVDIQANQEVLKNAYAGSAGNKGLLFWACVGGYFAMGLTWEQVNGDSTGTYNVTVVSAEAHAMVSKVLGVLACILTFMLFTKPLTS